MKFTGIVKQHLGRGKQLGFPTANVEAPTDIEDGLYLAWTNTDHQVRPSEKLPSLVFIGANETFDEKERGAEIYIIDFDGNLYGKVLEVEIIKKLRPVIKFSSSHMLIQQMKSDVAEARRFFKKLKARTACHLPTTFCRAV